MAQVQYNVVPAGGAAGNTNSVSADPINRYYNSLRYQVVYTAAELTAAGMPSGCVISRLAWNVTESSSSLANYTIKMGHTAATNSAAHNADATSTVKNAFTYAVATGFNDITFDAAFTWDGTSNLVVEICTGPANPYTTPYGGVQAKTGLAAGASRHYQLDHGVISACIFDTDVTNTTKPYVRFTGTGVPCSGLPAPGNPTGPATACPGVNFDLALQNLTPGTGVTYQWQSASDAAFTVNLTNLGTASTQTTSQTTPLYYRAQVTCPGGGTGTSTPLLVGMSPFYDCGCVGTTTGSSCAIDHITNVTFTSAATPINNTSTCNSGGTYSDYTGSLPAAGVSQLDNVAVTVSVIPNGDQYAAGWIDYDHSGTYEASEFIALTDADGMQPWFYNGTATIPITALTGITGMRFRSSYYSPIAPNSSCANYQYGETEDYVVTIAPVARAAVKVFLQGPYDEPSGLMSDALRTLPSFPLTEPFTSMGYSGATYVPGATIPTSVLSITGNNAITDWVLVEMRPAATPSTIAASRAVLLQRDGDVVDLDGVSTVGFAGLAPGSYSVAVRPRNHLPVMLSSSTPIVYGDAIASVDLTLPGTQVHDNDAHKNVSGVMVLIAGDITFDGTVKYAGGNNDRDPILTRIGGTVPTATVSGYWREDVNMNGQVKYAGSSNDRDPILNNIGGSVPTATRVATLP
ncbi:MAG: hypothetical protein IPH53_11235 [Flavobacteriales bacterium]|nr:hypothetical protein [Flavobacteriales bacterium]